LFTDELALFRYRYSKEVIFNKTCHIAIVNTEQHALSAAFMEIVQKYIGHLAHSKAISNICIEWQGNHILDYFDSCILPFTEYAKKLCAETEVLLRNQIGVQLSNNETIHDKLYHQKGIPTYQQTIAAIQRICSSYACYSLRATVAASPHSTADMDAFYALFSANAQMRLNLVWQPYSQAPDNENSVADEQAVFDSEGIEKNGGLWQLLLPPRLHQVILYADNSAYMAVPRKFGEDKPQGVLCEDGSIQWDELERENMLSNQWFENPKCRECSYLPLLIGVCSKQKVPLGMICPLDNKLVTPDDIIVKEVESQQT
jgi:hypothetical protein